MGMQHNVTFIPELFDKRFGRTAKVVLAGLIAFTMMGTVASQVTATATIINMLGGDIGLSYEVGALIATIVFMVYTATSGLVPVCVMAVSAIVMVIYGLLMRRPKLKWLSEYALPISLILGMAAAIPLTAILGMEVAK